MKNLIIKKLYTREELKSKIDEHMEKYEEHKSNNDYSSMISECNDITRFFEILEDKEKSNYYYQRIVDEWYAHLKGVPHYSCISALESLHRPEEALRVVLLNPKMWDIETLARLYEEVGRKGEAILIYSSLALFSFRLSEAYYPFWQPHYLQEAAGLYEKAQDFETAHMYNERAVKAWEKIKDSIQRPLYSIEEGWLYEEVGYIYEKTGNLETAMEYYQKAKSKYEQAHTEDPTAVFAHQIDGDWNDYFGFFVHQISDFRLIHFRSDSPEENDYRRIKYRILNLEEQMKAKR